jgi:hypothetical protein
VIGAFGLSSARFFFFFSETDLYVNTFMNCLKKKRIQMIDISVIEC